MRTLKVAGILFVAAVATLFALLWIEHRTAVALPAPTGPFAVGRALFDWRDDRGTRELLGWMWYPADARSGTLDDYVPAAVRQPPNHGLFALLTRDLSKVHGHSLRDARVSPHHRSFPVLILRGGASAPVMNYSTLAEDLASHGYMVVGFDAAYRTSVVVFPDGRIVRRTPQNNPELGADINRLLREWTADIGFVLDTLAKMNDARFAGRLDLTRVGVFGHSFGGSQALQFCHDDSRCKAGVDIDGIPLGSVVETGLDKPFMFLLSDHSGDADRAEVMPKIESIYNRLPANSRALVTIPHANHFTFSDDGALLKSFVFRAILRVDGRRQLALTAQDLRGFFDAHL